MIVVLGDLIADFSLRIEGFPILPGGMQRVEFIELGPGGATNVAITSARLGLQVACLGEVGDDRFGDVVRQDLASEGIDTKAIQVSAGAATPVAGVVVDAAGEPAYLGHRGSLRLRSLPASWAGIIARSEALFADGWADNEHAAVIVLEGLQAAKRSQVPIFFDPGPGNPEFDLSWHSEAAAMSTVVVLTHDELKNLTGQSNTDSAARRLFEEGVRLVAIKLGEQGCHLATKGQSIDLPAYPVSALDQTGAGDSFDGAVIYGFLQKLPLEQLGILANATGAAKVIKPGTGLNMPSADEIQAILHRFEPGPILGILESE